MELPGSAYLYTLATLAMTFAGFCAIVIVLRQTAGKDISGFHLVLTRLYLESGLFSAAFCMLPPLLALCGLAETTVWRVSSAIIAAVLICFGATYPRRRAAITAGSLPSTRWIPIVSVSMLTEGWDANTVTHIMGVRAFGTQLLCEQVVGRGLRRQSYELNEEGLFEVEYADILGIPFDFTAKPVVAPPRRPKPTVRVHAVKERAALEITFLIMLATLVSLNRATRSFVIGGKSPRSACGKITRRNARPRDMPSEAAASHWPTGTAPSPARYTSDS